VARIRDTCEAECQALDAALPQSTKLDSITFEAYLRSLNATKEGIETASVWTRAMLGVEPSEMSALFFLNYCKSGGGLLNMRSDRKGGGQHLRLRKGTQAIPIAMAADLPSGTVKLSTPATRIIQDGPHSVQVIAANDTTYSARKVISTVPSPALSMIQFEPALPPVKQAWSGAAGYGTYVKALVVFKSAFWVDKGCCGLVQSFIGPASVIRDTSSPVDDKHALTCFMVGKPAEEWNSLPYEGKKEKLLAQLSALYNDGKRVREEFIEMVTFDWSEDPWTGGGCPCASLTPGVLDTVSSGSLRQPVGNLHFAGTETAAEWKGYMEGAVRSGQRAASEVLLDFEKGAGSRL
jgi:monoamine oxidase